MFNEPPDLRQINSERPLDNFANFYRQPIYLLSYMGGHLFGAV